MKKLESMLSLFFSCFLLIPFESAYAQNVLQNFNTNTVPAPPHREIVRDTVKDPHSKYTARYSMGNGRYCTAILISSTAALTARHCGGNKRKTRAGTIYPGASGASTPFGYMNISEYIPHPNLSINPKYDIAIIKGNLRDQDKFYRYYIGKFKTKVKGYTDQELGSFKDKAAYSYGYPYLGDILYQYRSDGTITYYIDSFKLFYTDLPAVGGQSGSGVFLKSGQFIGIIIENTSDNKAIVLPFTQEIADWINKYAN